MAGVLEETGFGRLEAFALLAKQGEDVHMEVEPRKQLVKQDAHQGKTEGIKNEIDTYLLIADYTFTIKEEPYDVSKVYLFATLEESVDAARMNKTIANARLQADYGRLKAENITFEEKYF